MIERTEFLKITGSFYNFDLDDKVQIDSRTMGNESAIFNHSKQLTNCESRNVLVCGERRILLFANQNIFPGQEVLFDYDVAGVLKEIYSWAEKDQLVEKIKNDFFN